MGINENNSTTSDVDDGFGILSDYADPDLRSKELHAWETAMIKKHTGREMTSVLQAYEGFLEQGRFFPLGSPLNLKGRCRVILTVLDEPAESIESNIDMTRRVAALDKFFQEIESSDEEVPSTFERVNFNRELEL